MLQPPSASQIAIATADRENKLQNLKNKIIWVCCAKSLSPPLQYVGALKYEKNDTEDEKIARRLEHTIKVNEREEERIRREPELLRELEKIMDRVRQARLEYVRPEIDYAASANAQAIVRYYCEKCNNQVCLSSDYTDISFYLFHVHFIFILLCEKCNDQVCFILFIPCYFLTVFFYF